MGAPHLPDYGLSACDATHVTHPSSTGQVKAIRNALNDAGLDPGAIDYVNAHGTGTPTGDAVEEESIRAVFSEHLHTLPVSSSKAVQGHLMGAGGAAELAIAIIAMQKTWYHRPPTAE